jgi:uncharacterized damage-inducible protein DinB
MNDSSFRENLVELLMGGQGHITLEDALSGLKPENRHARPSKDTHTIWEDLEHMRLAQEDILRYTLDSKWQALEFPAGYWPPPTATLTEAQWRKTVDGLNSDLEELIALVRDTRIDLTQRIPHGEWRTYLREILLAADHNAYHLGQVVQTRKLLGDWPASS